MNQSLNEIDLAILRMMSKSQLGTDQTGRYTGVDLIYRNFGELLQERVAASLGKLQDMNYISDPIQNKKHSSFVLSPLGSSALESQQNIEISTFSNITNSAIAHKSSNVAQTVNIQDLPDDVVEQVAEFDSAVKVKDSNRMKTAFGYIADKSVDAAIALATGVLLR